MSTTVTYEICPGCGEAVTVESKHGEPPVRRHAPDSTCPTADRD